MRKGYLWREVSWVFGWQEKLCPCNLELCWPLRGVTWSLHSFHLCSKSHLQPDPNKVQSMKLVYLWSEGFNRPIFMMFIWRQNTIREEKQRKKYCWQLTLILPSCQADPPSAILRTNRGIPSPPRMLKPKPRSPFLSKTCVLLPALISSPRCSGSSWLTGTLPLSLFPVLFWRAPNGADFGRDGWRFSLSRISFIRDSSMFYGRK